MKTNKYYIIAFFVVVTLGFLYLRCKDTCENGKVIPAPIPQKVQPPDPEQVLPPESVTPEQRNRIEEISIPLEKIKTLSLCTRYQYIGKSLFKENSVTLCVGNTSFLMVYDHATDQDAETIYNNWVKKAKKHNRFLKKDNIVLDVHVLDYRDVSQSHYCTDFKKH
jgi:hypothetical protein